MKIIKDTREQLEHQTIDIIEQEVKNIQKNNILLGIPGGRSVHGIFGLLKKADLPWNRIHLFMIDERFVDVSDDQSNYKGAKTQFIDQLVGSGTLPLTNIHPFYYKNGDQDGGVGRYAEEFCSVGDHFDIVLLGVGEDGHVASLFPNHPSLGDKSSSFIHINDSPKPPSQRMSASLSLLEKSDVAIALFFGQHKQQALSLFLDKSRKVHECPAKLIESVPRSYVLTDQAP